ncbi:MAG: IclR family transcriptional regulator [Desulfovibrio sp.]|jgi:DNA-binding IclR family transcriptional regulator|nr:IclR family transcriptional regulator [Desulfovibrio sp.]
MAALLQWPVNGMEKTSALGEDTVKGEEDGRVGTMKEISVRSLERAFSILQCFDLDTEELTLTQITEKLSLAPSTALRLVSCLTRLGFLNRSKTKSYFLGTQAYLLGVVASAHFKLHRIVDPIMKQLRDETKEAVSLYAIEGEYRVCYHHVESLQSMRCIVRIGERFPLWAGAAGKCFLAYADDDIVQREMDKLHPLTPSSILDKEKFSEELQLIREKEEAISFGEREMGITSTAVPIFSRKNQVEYTLSIAAPSGRGTSSALRLFIQRSKEAARAIAKQLYS